MIGWLQGTVADCWQQDKRCGLLLLVNGVGYELLVSQRQWQRLPPAGQSLGLHVHTQLRDDAWTLFGFGERHERDLFRELVGVSGVGPQMALGLLGAMASEELVRAIVQADLRLLTQAPGVGKRTAERLAVELRTRLQQRYPGQTGPADDGALERVSPGLEPPRQEEVQLTLAALGYEALEIQRALRAVASGGDAAAGDAADVWIRACLQWLSRDLS
jgi:Holliday junction DNA helicase RuvA